MSQLDQAHLKWQMEQIPEIQELWLAAQQGDAEAQFKLGKVFQSGKGFLLDREIKEATHWFQKAAQQGHIKAKYQLSQYPNNDEQISWLHQLAEQGYAEAQVDLAHFYRETDITKAIYWLRQAAEQEDVITELTSMRFLDKSPQNEARKELGEIYKFGRYGVTRDYKQALFWYQKAAEHGSEEVKGSLEFLQGVIQALDESRQAAEQGNAQAQRWLGMEEEELGNYEKAIDLYKKLAEQGYYLAYLELIRIYEDGKIVAQDHEQAVYWYRQFAERDFAQLEADNIPLFAKPGKNETQEDYTKQLNHERKWLREEYVKAQFSLGYAYNNGEGIDQDDKQAVYWYRQAAENGHKRAQFFLGYAYDYGQGVPQDRQQALYWYQQAAQETKYSLKGDSDAQFNLAYAYQKGEGVSQDDAKAVYWYAKAARAGDVEAQLQLGKIYEQVEMIQDYEQLISWYRALELNHYSYMKKLINQQLDEYYAHCIKYEGPKGYSKHIISECIGTAISCYKEAAKQGYSKALLYLGLRQTREKNSNESVFWLCQLALHIIFDFKKYDELELFEDDDEKAIASLCHQAEQGLSVAQTVLANLYQTGNGLPQDQKQALYWFDQAAQQQDIVAQYWLGEIHFKQLDFKTAQAYLQVVCQNPHEGDYDESDITRIQLRAKDKLLVLKGIEQERKAKQYLESIMAMFAHKFRGPLQNIRYNAEHDNQKQVTLQAVQAMSGLLNIFSIIAMDAELFRSKLQQDMQGDGTLMKVLEKVLLLVLKQILTLDNTEKICQHYLSYAKRIKQVPTNITCKQWVEDYDLEEQLQKEWEESFSQLLAGPEPFFDKLKAWFEERFFPLEISGFDDKTINFKHYGTTESTLHIVLTEVLLNAIKYYYSETREPVKLLWQHDDDFCSIITENPSHRDEQSIDKGSKKGHKFLSIIALNLHGQFPNPLPKDTYRIEWRIPTDLLVKEHK